MTTNKSMTYFHKIEENHTQTWVKGTIDNVMWQEKTQVNPDTGFREISEVDVYIPFLTDDIQNEDIIVKGETTANNPTEIVGRYYVVTSSIPCDYGSENMQHTELVGK